MGQLTIRDSHNGHSHAGHGFCSLLSSETSLFAGQAAGGLLQLDTRRAGLVSPLYHCGL